MPKRVDAAVPVRDTRNDVFVGSSSEFLALPWKPQQVIREVLDGLVLADGSRLTVTIWRDWFKAHQGIETFQVLDLAAKTMEWAVLVFRGDDVRRSLAGKAIREETVRDNVLFELGLFYGYLGTQRVFILEEEKRGGRRTRIAGDIGGIQRLRFSTKESFRDALTNVRQTIEERSRMFFARWAPASSLAIGYAEQALRSFITRRRDHGRSAFTLEVLIPWESFKNLQFNDVRQVFEGAGYQQVGADGSASGRPAMWADRRNGNPPADTVYFDIPTTLFTAQRVVEGYLGNSATPREITRLVSSQARAFARELERQEIREVVVNTSFCTVGEIGDYLTKRGTSSTP